MARQSVSFIIPYFNEAASLPRLINEVGDFVRRAESKWSLAFDLILVDDGSKDGGSDILRSYVKANPGALKLRIIRLSRNFGKEVALTAGLSVADSDAVVLMDADLQHPIDIVDQFLDGWINEGADVVYAYQPKEQRDGWLNRMLSKAYYKIINTMAEVSVPPNAGDFRLLSKRAYSALRELGERQRMMKGLYSWIGFQQKGIAFTSRPRLFGKTKFSPLRLSVLAIDGITSFSTLPLRLTVLAGILLALLAGGYGVWIIIQIFVYGADVPGFATLIVAITSIGAAQLIFLGIIGEYIGKILLEVKRRPLFIVESDERLGGNLLTPAGRTRVEEHIS